MTAIKKIEKVKSFDKRIEILEGICEELTPDVANACVGLVAEKARYGQHFVELVSVAGVLDIEDKEEKLLQFALRANEHPTQAGQSAWVLSQLGYDKSAQKVMESLIESTKTSHPNLRAQALAFGCFFPVMQQEIEVAINACKAEHPEVPEQLYDKPDLSKVTCLQRWL
jgi:hypothetical protein